MLVGLAKLCWRMLQGMLVYMLQAQAWSCDANLLNRCDSHLLASCPKEANMRCKWRLSWNSARTFSTAPVRRLVYSSPSSASLLVSTGIPLLDLTSCSSVTRQECEDFAPGRGSGATSSKRCRAGKGESTDRKLKCAYSGVHT